MQLSTPAALFALLCVTACSGGGGSPASNRTSGQNLEILVDTSTGSGSTVTAQIDVVALERVDGTFTNNLLQTPISLTLADPSGRPAVLHLTGVEPGAYQAVRLLFHPDGGTLEDSTKKMFSLRTEPMDDRVVLDEVIVTRPGDDRFLALRHHGEIEVGDDGGGGRRWRPDLSGRNGAAQPLALVELLVASIDAGRFRFSAAMHAHGGEVVVEVVVPETAKLFGVAKNAIDRATFFTQLKSGSEVKAAGKLDAGLVFTADVARLDDGPVGGGAGGGVMPESEGKIAEVRAATSEMVVVPRGNDPLVVNGKSVTSVIVHVASSTRLFHADRPSQRLKVADLQAGWRIWVRGTPAGSGVLEAAWVRVRAD